MTRLEQIAHRNADLFVSGDANTPDPYYNILTALREWTEECVDAVYKVGGDNASEHVSAIRAMAKEEV